MTTCWCRIILALLVIVFAWWNVTWAPFALTIIGIILALMAANKNACCCKSKGEKKK